MPEPVEVLHARFSQHRFGVHAHEGWSVGAMIGGAKDIAPRSELPRQFRRGDVYVIEPGRAHAGKIIGGSSCEYVMVYVSDAEWRRQCEAYGLTPQWLQANLPTHSLLAAHLCAFVARALSHPERLVAWDGEWQLFWEEFARVGQHATRGSMPARVSADWRIQRAEDFLRVNYSGEVTLEVLAREASMSIFDLCRKFSATYGLSPHRYQLVLRVQDAKRRLIHGEAVSEVAAALGFADQSHLGRHFKSLLGVTPGSVARQSRYARTF